MTVGRRKHFVKQGCLSDCSASYSSAYIKIWRYDQFIENDKRRLVWLRKLSFGFEELYVASNVPRETRVEPEVRESAKWAVN